MLQVSIIRDVRRIVRLLLLVALSLVTGCDPGFTVRQANIHPRKPLSLPLTMPQVRVEVRKFHTLAGVRYYGPRVSISNMSDSPIEVTGIELVTKRGTYASRSPRLPLRIEAGIQGETDVSFELSEELQKAFKSAAELRVHYTIGKTTGAASVGLLGKIQAAD